MRSKKNTCPAASLPSKVRANVLLLFGAALCGVRTVWYWVYLVVVRFAVNVIFSDAKISLVTLERREAVMWLIFFLYLG